MYKVEWDKETGGVILNNRITDQTLGIAPRPVFFEELDLLGLDKLGWVYPHCEEPLMWAINKQYYYRGEKLFEAKGANIYTMPTLEFGKEIEPMPLKPVDMSGMLAKTADIMFVLENEAIEFIRDTYTVYVKVNKAYEKAEPKGPRNESVKKWQSSNKIATALILCRWTMQKPRERRLYCLLK